MRKILVIAVLLAVAVVGYTVAYGAEVAYEAVYTVGEGEGEFVVDSVSSAIADAAEHYSDEDDEDPDSYKVIKIILTRDITEEDLAEIPLEDEETEFRRITLQGERQSIRIEGTEVKRLMTMNNAKLTLGLENLTIAGNEDAKK